MGAQIENSVQCKSMSNWDIKIPSSTPGKHYNVSLEYQRGGPYQYALECNCKGYQFRKTCSHVKLAEEKYCGWSQQMDGGYKGDGKCPKCGEKVEGVRIAV